MINYISAHDNQTLFDNNQYKIPIATTMADRVRINNLGMALISRLDCRRSKITKEIPKTISIPDYAGSSLALHPILQQSSADRIVRQSQYRPSLPWRALGESTRSGRSE